MPMLGGVAASIAKQVAVGIAVKGVSKLAGNLTKRLTGSDAGASVPHSMMAFAQPSGMQRLVSAAVPALASAAAGAMAKSAFQQTLLKQVKGGGEDA